MMTTTKDTDSNMTEFEQRWGVPKALTAPPEEVDPALSMLREMHACLQIIAGWVRFGGIVLVILCVLAALAFCGVL